MQVLLYQKWYDFFNNPTQPIYKVLTYDQTIFPNNIIIAKKNPTHWQYTKFISLKHFINFFVNTNSAQRTFYVILTHQSRYLYLDIDYKLKNTMSIKIHKQLISNLTNSLNKFTKTYGYKFGVKYYQSSWIIWDASRFDKKAQVYYQKFSLHFIDCGNVMHYLDIKHFAETFDYWLHKNNKINQNLNIDNNIYHNKYQAWRLPYNHNGDINSVLTIHGRKISIMEQMKINTMIDTQTISAVLICKNDIQRNGCNQKALCDSKLHDMINIPDRITCDENVNHKILQRIYTTFRISKFLYFTKGEYIIKQHYCPIQKKKHKSNSARIKIIQMSNCDTYTYCIYTCMDCDCQKVIRRMYISLSDIFKRPWLMHGLLTLDTKVHREIDYFIQLLLDKHILKFHERSNYLILKQNKIKLNLPNHLFTTFCHDHIQHNRCNSNDISFSYKKSQHPLTNYGKATLYCRTCNQFINLKQNTLVYNL